MEQKYIREYNEYLSFAQYFRIKKLVEASERERKNSEKYKARIADGSANFIVKHSQLKEY